MSTRGRRRELSLKEVCQVATWIVDVVQISILYYMSPWLLYLYAIVRATGS
jgi:hypothetical protein